jgi:hypothetical protein
VRLCDRVNKIERGIVQSKQGRPYQALVRDAGSLIFDQRASRTYLPCFLSTSPYPMPCCCCSKSCRIPPRLANRSAPRRQGGPRKGTCPEAARGRRGPQRRHSPHAPTRDLMRSMTTVQLAAAHWWGLPFRLRFPGSPFCEMHPLLHRN